MPTPLSTGVLGALGEFVARIDGLDPEAPMLGELTLHLNGQTSRIPLRTPVAQALIEALLAYHDPRDRGSCDHCPTGRLDDDFVCRDCGVVNGIFGQLVTEIVARSRRSLEGPPGP